MSTTGDTPPRGGPDTHHGVDALFGSWDADTAPPDEQSDLYPDPHPRPRRRRRHGVVPVIALVLVVVIGLGGWYLVRDLGSSFQAKDYAGAGTGSVLVQVRAGDGSAEIGDTLVTRSVVASRRAFVSAAEHSGRAGDFQPGFFRLRLRMASADAVTMLLDPASRVTTKLTLPEGVTVAHALTVVARATGLPLRDLQSAARNLPDLGIPKGFSARSAEGFLYPETYTLDPGSSALQVLQQMVQQFGSVERGLNFDAAAAKVALSPYQAVIVASMIESEAKYDGDRAKVARVIYNRTARRMPLGIDATSLYGAQLSGKKPQDVTYREKSPYNTRLRPGLPPTPISNPGQQSLTAAVTPAAGNWLYYVNADAAGHLFFTNDPKQFEAAAQRCRAHHWGCT